MIFKRSLGDSNNETGIFDETTHHFFEKREEPLTALPEESKLSHLLLNGGAVLRRGVENPRGMTTPSFSLQQSRLKEPIVYISQSQGHGSTGE